MTEKPKLYNPALYKEPRYEPAPVIAVLRDMSLLDWLELENRLIYRNDQKEMEAESTNQDSDIEMETIIEESDDDYKGFEGDDTPDEPEEV